ncbi:MAG: VPLPA-CTERM sorting domain-containing protein [Silicimonas sp.]|nr:VPLPA-CTERM sorting domain-containing protein [Silicimonas sp.]
MTPIFRTIVTTFALAFAPALASAAPVSVSGDFTFDGDENVAAFSIAFDSVIDVQPDTEFVDLPLASGAVTIGGKTFRDDAFLRFATNRVGGFGAMVLSQDSNPFAGAELPIFFQIVAALPFGTDINTILTTPVRAPLRDFGYIIPGATPADRPIFDFANTGLGLIEIAPVSAVPLPASGLMLLGAFGLAGALRTRRKTA